MSRASVLKAAVLVALVAAAVVVQLVVGLPSQAEVRSGFDGLGAWAVPTFVAVYVGVSLLPAGPTAVLTIVGGALFGVGVGLPVVLLGAYLGSAAAFATSRYLGRGAVAGSGSARVRRVDAEVREHGLVTVLVARLVPLVPFSTANYVFGLTSVRVRDYSVATVVGIVPGTAVYVSVGAFGSEPGSVPFLLALGALVLLSLVALLRGRLTGRRDGPARAPTDDAPPPARR